MKLFICALLLICAASVLAKPTKLNELHAKPGAKLHGLGALNSLLGRRAADDLPPTSAEPETTPGDGEDTTTPIIDTTAPFPEPGDTVSDLDLLLSSPPPQEEGGTVP